MKKELKVGDKIFLSKGSILSGFETILKTTRTTAKSENYIFRLEIYDDGQCSIKTSNIWSTVSAYLATEKLEKEWKEQTMVIWYYANKDRFTNEQIEKIYNLLNN